MFLRIFAVLKSTSLVVLSLLPNNWLAQFSPMGIRTCSHEHTSGKCIQIEKKQEKAKSFEKNPSYRTANSDDAMVWR
jgi:hypothetical protein